MARTKYHVDKDKSVRTYDSIVFDSRMEMQYYTDVLLPKVESGEVTCYELQKPYELQPKYKHGDRTVLPIKYVADFYIEYADGQIDVVDVKGVADGVAKLKRKLFWYKYPELNYYWITYSKKWGGWIEYDQLNKLRREAKRKEKKGNLDGEENQESDCLEVG